MSGYLSQTIANLLAAEKQVSALNGLPAAAKTIQSESLAAISPAITQVQSLQTAVAGFVKNATAQLQSIETMVLGGQPLAQIQAAMGKVQTEANALKSTSEATDASIASLQSQVLGYFGELAGIESDLSGQMSALQGQLGTARGEEDAAKKKYYYLLALGPFGLVGLAVALGLYLKWKSDVNGYESQISSLEAQIYTFETLRAATRLIGSDFQGVVTKISGVKNSVEFIAADILTIDTDVGTGTDLSTIAIMVKAAMTEVATLGVDAS